MGLQVGQTTVRNLDPRTSLLPPRETIPGAPDNSAQQVGFRPRSELSSANPFQPEEIPANEVGFGRGSISVPTAAVRTIDRNLEAAERVVPTLEETREQIRERIDEVQAQLEGLRGEPVELRGFDVTVGRTEAVGQARSFVNGVNQAAQTALARTQGEEPPPQGPRLDVRVGDATLPLLQQTQSPSFEFFA